MHVPSSSDYQPFYPGADTVFEDHNIDVYITLAVMTLVFYDHWITLDIEVDRIWTLKWGLPKFLFLTSRYVIPSLLMINVIGHIGYPLVFDFCVFETHYAQLGRALSLIVADLILLIRVCALYGHSKMILSFLACLFLGHLAGVIVVAVFSETIFITVIRVEFLPGCWMEIDQSSSAKRWNYSWPIPFICFEAILLILTLVKAFHYRNHSNTAMKLLARDSTLYFVIMFVSLLENLIAVAGSNWVIVFIPTEWIACIAVSRMMLNIRGLKFNDPLATQGVQFSTIMFKHQDHTSFSQGTVEQHTISRV